ncbi:MAG: YdeI/OmpD-associated family protein [Anaerolineaceae bacterium]|nr:YdeI/OmpD-associated family protein [Anaerolineaceae bacterium]
MERDQDSQATWIVIPQDIQQAYGARGRVAVCGSLNNTPFRSSIFPYGGVHYLAVTQKQRQKLGVAAGDRLRVVIERYTEPRIVIPPPDLETALAANPSVRAAWEKLSYSHQREHVNFIEEAKKPETRARRITRTVETLSADQTR